MLNTPVDTILVDNWQYLPEGRLCGIPPLGTLLTDVSKKCQLSMVTPTWSQLLEGLRQDNSDFKASYIVNSRPDLAAQ